MKLRVKCYAKINLGLRVLGQRPDGYHELRTVFQSIALHDTLEISRERGPAGVVLECNVAELAGPGNLAARAAQAMCDELKLRGRVRLRLFKRIPRGAGLGGGSSDAAAALRAVALLAGRPLPLARLLPLAASLGADVPFFLLGGTALGVGRGTEVRSLPDLRGRPLLVVFPGVHVDTARAYAALDSERDSSAGRKRNPSLTVAAETDRILSFSASFGKPGGNWLENDFEPVVFSTYPQIERLKKYLTRAGASPALLSGSGSAVYGFFGSRQKAEQAGRALVSRHPEFQLWVTRTVTRAAFERQWSVASGN